MTCPQCGRPRAAVYARISDDQRGERLGVTDQIEDCWGRAGERGWCTCTPADDTYSDNDVGAYRRKRRPGYEALLAALKDGRYAVLVTRDDGRLNRNVKGHAELSDLVEQLRVHVEPIWTEHWDFTTAAGRKRIRDAASDAQYEAERTGERVARARLRDARKGKPAPGGQRAWGFAPNRIDHEPEEAGAIRDVAARLLAGESLRSASLRYGKNPKDVRRALLTPRMVGLREYKGTSYPAVWEGVLERDTWEAVGALLRARNRDRVAGVTARAHLLTGLVYCGVCGARCQIVSPRSGGKVYRKYACWPRGCTVRSAPRLDEHVRDEVLARAGVTVTPAAIDPALTGAVGGYEARLAEAWELFAEGRIPKDEYAGRRADLEDRLTDARARLAEASLTTVVWVDVEHRMAGGERYAKGRVWWDAADLRQRRSLLAQHVERITLLPRPGGPRRFDPASVEVVWR